MGVADRGRARRYEYAGMTDAEINRLLEELGERSPECRILVGIIHHLQSVIAELRAENAQLRVRVRALGAGLEEERRKSGRPTAPRRITGEKRAANPKRPGRPPGHQGAFRAKPDHVDETAEALLTACPAGNRTLARVR